MLGGGFAGLTFGRTSSSHLARITIVDRQNHPLFQPLLYQVATAGLAAPGIAQPKGSILRNKPDRTVLMAEARGIDPAALSVQLDALFSGW